MTSIADVRNKAANAAFGKPLVTNVLRGLVVEAIVALALEPEWNWCAADYASWDFERADGKRLEVKQSAAMQTWSIEKPSRCSFDIASRKGRWEDEGWIDEPGRAAHLYICAHHPVFGDEADHRDPGQWDFYVIPSSILPDTQRLSIGAAIKLAERVCFLGLAERVGLIANSV